MVVSAGVILIIGGLCALAPLFKRASQSLARFLTILGLFVGVVVLVVAIDYALALNFLSSITQIPSPTDLSSLSAPYLKYFLPAMIVLGVLLVSRPIRNVRWASLISLSLGLLVPYLLRALFPSIFSGTIALAIVFLIVTLAIYTLLRFVEDIFKLISSILAFPPIAIAIGLVNIYFGILFFSV